ncbi:hypothetical protein BG005_002760, partial [Podila minutissima]
VVALVRRNPGLVTLRFGHDQTVETIQELVSVLQQDLREFRLSTAVSPNTAKFFLENLPDGIRAISLNIYVNADEQDHEYLPTSTGPRPHLLLESLRITGVFAGFQEHALFPFLGRCSTKLKKIEIPETGYFSCKTIASALHLLGLHFTSFYPAELPSGKDSLDGDIADLLDANPQLTSVHLTSCRSAGWLTAAVLYTSEHLQGLDLCGSDLPSRELRTILTGAKNLRFVDAITPRPTRAQLESTIISPLLPPCARTTTTPSFLRTMLWMASGRPRPWSASLAGSGCSDPNGRYQSLTEHWTHPWTRTRPRCSRRCSGKCIGNLPYRPV